MARRMNASFEATTIIGGAVFIEDCGPASVEHTPNDLAVCAALTTRCAR